MHSVSHLLIYSFHHLFFIKHTSPSGTAEREARQTMVNVDSETSGWLDGQMGAWMNGWAEAAPWTR